MYNLSEYSFLTMTVSLYAWELGYIRQEKNHKTEIIQSLKSLFCERINTKLRAKNIIIENMLHLGQLCLNNLIPSKLILKC